MLLNSSRCHGRDPAGGQEGPAASLLLALFTRIACMHVQRFRSLRPRRPVHFIVEFILSHTDIVETSLEELDGVH